MGSSLAYGASFEFENTKVLKVEEKTTTIVFGEITEKDVVSERKRKVVTTIKIKDYDKAVKAIEKAKNQIIR